MQCHLKYNVYRNIKHKYNLFKCFLFHEVEEAMRRNKKLTSINKKQESAISVLKQVILS